MIQAKTFRVLSQDEIQRIHLATLELLERTGVAFREKEAQEVFLEYGFEVDHNGVVRFPPHRVEEVIRQTPRRFTREGLNPARKVRMGEKRAHFGVGSLPLYVFDLETGERRLATKQDMMDFSRLGDKLEYFDISNACVQASDVPEEIIHIVWLQVQFKTSGKPFCCWYARKPQVALDTIEVASAALGGLDELKKKKTIAITVCPDSALQWGKSIIGLIEFSKVGLPIEIMPMPFAGSIDPVTLAGTIVQANAEILGAVVLAELINSGTPVIYAPYAGIMDMQSATHTFGGPEAALMSAAWTQLSAFYGIPNDMVVGTSDSKVADAQAAYEKMMIALPCVLAGVDSLSLFGGMVDFAMTASYEQLVIDNDIAGCIRRIIQGIAVKDETLALDVINEVGHGGNFLTHEHTLRHFKQEQYLSSLRDRGSRASWESSGAKDIFQRAKERVRQILSEESISPLPPDRERDMDEVIQAICDREGLGRQKK